MNGDLFAEAQRLSKLIDAGIEHLREQAHAVAEAEREYRKAKAHAWVEAPRGEKRGDITAGEREAWVNGQTADLRYTRDLADGLRAAATEAVRSRRTQLSALQTFVNADRAEAELARTGPR